MTISDEFYCCCDSRSLALLNSSVYATNHLASLNGIPQQRPLVAPPNIITPPPPTCSPAVEPQYSSIGRRFGDEPVSYAMFAPDGLRSRFNLRYNCQAKSSSHSALYLFNTSGSTRRCPGLKRNVNYFCFEM